MVFNKRIVDSAVIEENGIPYLYVFNYENGGWAIISSDKRTMPVLAYSDEGAFKIGSEPEGVLSWEAMSKQIIKDLRSSRSHDENSIISSEWSMMECIPEQVRMGNSSNDCRSPDEFVSQVTVGPLLSTAWGQGCGYNDFCPPISGGQCGRAWAGCVATAMAQVIRYWQYPNGYNYTGMSSIGGNPNVARLMADCGVAVNMNYGAESSGADTKDAASALRGAFGYSSAVYRNQNNYSHWEVVSNLDLARPVILAACTEQSTVVGIPYSWDGCHAWVCDGYRRTNFMWDILT